MTRLWMTAFGFMIVSASQAESPSTCQGLLSDPEVYAKVMDAVNSTLVENNGYRVTSDKIFSNLADWINALSWLEEKPTLYTRLQKIWSTMDSAQTREQIIACYPNLDKFLHPEAAKQADAAKHVGAEKQAEAARQAAATNRLEALKQKEKAARQRLGAAAPEPTQAEEAAKQRWDAAAPERAQAEEAAKERWDAAAPERAQADEAAKQRLEAAKHRWEAVAPERAQAEEAAKQQLEAAKQRWDATAPERAAKASEQAEAAKQVEAAKQAEAAKQKEDAARQKLEAEARARTQAEEDAGQAELKLKLAYADSIIVKRCHAERESDDTSYINETQLANAQAALSVLEQKFKNLNIDLNTIRNQAQTVADDNFSRLDEREVGRLCLGALIQLTGKYSVLNF